LIERECEEGLKRGGEIEEEEEDLRVFSGWRLNAKRPIFSYEMSICHLGIALNDVGFVYSKEKSKL
jgi:hypothetical protein